jgi:hypothetical protein
MKSLKLTHVVLSVAFWVFLGAAIFGREDLFDWSVIGAVVSFFMAFFIKLCDKHFDKQAARVEALRNESPSNYRRQF